MAFSFKVIHKDSGCGARLGRLNAGSTEVSTPAFMPVGTRGVVKTVSPEEVWGLGYRLILANAYHLFLRPGHELIERHGGLHKFMDWPGSLLTDSGGFQVFSLARLRKITDQGVLFQSHIDGSSHLFTPELSIQVQEALGSDIIMCLDDVRGYPVAKEEALEAVVRTGRWAERCLNSKKKVDPGLFGIVQGSVYSDLRKLSTDSLTSLDLDGYAVGGLSVGEPHDSMVEMLEVTVPLLRVGSPQIRHGGGKATRYS